MNTNDLVLVLGLVIAVLTVPAIFSAFVDGGAPRSATISAVVAGGLILYALYNEPNGYSVEELPEVFTRVISSLIR